MRKGTDVTFPDVARYLGYAPITAPYTDGERWMLDNAVNDLKKDGCKYLIVATGGGHEIWRPRDELKTITGSVPQC
jgi:RNase adaptor protein for sRNA GlmZ degradation